MTEYETVVTEIQARNLRNTKRCQVQRHVLRELRHFPEQIQIFTPTPSTFSTLMYYTGRDPFSGKALFVERDMHRKQQQKNQIMRRGKDKGPRPGKTGNFHRE